MVKTSKFISLILRHKPEAGNLTLDAEGWAKVDDVLTAIRKNVGPITKDELEKLVADSDKQRFAFNERKDKIRANQGHSVNVDLKLEPKTPPAILYHGTKTSNLGSIMKDGLKKGSRQHVHLSRDTATADIVAARRAGNSIILKIDAAAMTDYTFYESENGVWLIDHVPAQFIEIAATPM